MFATVINGKTIITYLNCDIHLSNAVDICGQNKKQQRSVLSYPILPVLWTQENGASAPNIVTHVKYNFLFVF